MNWNQPRLPRTVGNCMDSDTYVMTGERPGGTVTCGNCGTSDVPVYAGTDGLPYIAAHPMPAQSER